MATEISLTEARATPGFQNMSDKDIISHAESNGFNVTGTEGKNETPLTMEQARDVPGFESASDKEIITNARKAGLDTSGLLPEYTIGAKAGDVGRLFMQGVTGIGGNIGYLMDKTGIEPYKGAGAALDKSGSEESARLGSHLSPQMQEAQQTQLVNPEYTSGKEGGSSYLNPNFGMTELVANTIPSIPSTLVMGVSSAPLMAAAEAGLGALGVGAKAARVLGSGIGAGASEGPMSAVQDADQWSAEQKAKPISEFISSPEFQAEYKANGGDANAAKIAVIKKGENKILRDVSWQTGITDVLTAGGLPGMLRNAHGPLAKAVKGGFIANTLKGMGTEGGQEFLQSGAEQRTMNQAQQHVNPNQKEWEGVTNAALTGGASGAAMGLVGGGGGVNASQGPSPIQSVEGTSTPAQDPQEAADQDALRAATAKKIAEEEAQQATEQAPEQAAEQPISAYVPTDVYGNDINKVEPDLEQRKARVQRAKEEIVKLNAADEDAREIAIGDKTYAAPKFIKSQIVNGGVTYDEAKANFDKLHEEQNLTPQPEIDNGGNPTPDATLPEAPTGSAGQEPVSGRTDSAPDSEINPTDGTVNENNTSTTPEENVQALPNAAGDTAQVVGELPSGQEEIIPAPAEPLTQPENSNGNTSETIPQQEAPNALPQEEKRLLGEVKAPEQSGVKKPFNAAENYQWRKEKGYLPWQMTKEEYSAFYDEHSPKTGNTYADADRSMRKTTIMNGHKRDVQSAIENGETVPSAVLADYPDLQPTDTTTSNQKNEETNGQVSETSTVQPIPPNSGTGSKRASKAKGHVSTGQATEGAKSAEQKAPDVTQISKTHTRVNAKAQVELINTGTGQYVFPDKTFKTPAEAKKFFNATKKAQLAEQAKNVEVAPEKSRDAERGEAIAHIFNAIPAGNHYVNAGSTANEKYITEADLDKYVARANKDLKPKDKITSQELLQDGIINGAYTGGIGSIEKMSSSKDYPAMVKGKSRNIRIKVSPEFNKGTTPLTPLQESAPSAVTPEQAKADTADINRIMEKIATDKENATERKVSAANNHEIYKQAVKGIKAANEKLAQKQPGTVNHENRVAATVAMIAKKLNLDKDTKARALIAAKGHDVGKTGMHKIVNKDTGLTDAEFAIVKKHPELTERILTHKKYGVDSRIARIGAEHHMQAAEGKGYPMHAGTPSFASQLLQIADIADSLIGGADSGHTKPTITWFENGERKSGTRTRSNIISAMNAMRDSGEINSDIYSVYKQMLASNAIPAAQRAQLELTQKEEDAKTEVKPEKPKVEEPKASQSDQPTVDAFSNAEEAVAHLVSELGPGIKTLINNKLLNTVESAEEYPEVAKTKGYEESGAVFINGRTYLNYNNVDKGRLSGVVLHEIGEHYNLKRMLGEKAYYDLQRHIANLAKKEGSLENKMWNKVAENYPIEVVGSERFISEVMANLGEKNRNLVWYKRLISRVKSFLAKHGILVGKLTGEDMHALLVSSLHSAMNGRVKDEARLFNSAAMASRTEATKQASEKRIKELFNGAKPEQAHGVKILDKSDIFDMLGLSKDAILMAEKHGLVEGKISHAGFTENDWNKIPEQMDSPVAVFKQEDGAYRFIGSELKDGNPVVMAALPVEQSKADRTKKVGVLKTAFAKDDSTKRMPVQQWLDHGDLVYVDLAKVAQFNKDTGYKLPLRLNDLKVISQKVAFKNKELAKQKRKLLENPVVKTESNLAAYKAEELKKNPEAVVTSGTIHPDRSTEQRDSNKEKSLSTGTRADTTYSAGHTEQKDPNKKKNPAPVETSGTIHPDRAADKQGSNKAKNLAAVEAVDTIHSTSATEQQDSKVATIQQNENDVKFSKVEKPNEKQGLTQHEKGDILGKINETLKNVNPIDPGLHPNITPLILSELKLEISNGKQTARIPANEILEADKEDITAYENFILCLKGMSNANQ